MKLFSIFLTAGLLLLCPYIFPQEKPNSIYFELLGNGGLYSINYDRHITESFGFRAGIMYMPSLDIIFTSFDNLLFLPFTVNYFAGSENNWLELGAGIVYVSITGGQVFLMEFEGGSGVVGTATIGYRYQNPGGGFLFRIGFTPLFSTEGFQPYGGISVGTSF